MEIGNIVVEVRFPDLSPADVELLEEASECLADFREEWHAAGLLDLADRIRRMLLTSNVRCEPKE